MAQNKKNLDQASAPQAPASRLQALWIIIPLLILVVGAGMFAFLHFRAQALQQAHVRYLQQANGGLGLPLDYPLDVVPLYQGAKVEEAKRDTAKSDTGQSLDQWTIVARVEGPPKPVYEYYKALMEGRGMQQVLFASIPKGYGIQYSDEQYRVEFEIEKPHSTDTFTRLKITLYRVQR